MLCLIDERKYQYRNFECHASSMLCARPQTHLWKDTATSNKCHNQCQMIVKHEHYRTKLILNAMSRLLLVST